MLHISMHRQIKAVLAGIQEAPAPPMPVPRTGKEGARVPRRARSPEGLHRVPRDPTSILDRTATTAKISAKES